MITGLAATHWLRGTAVLLACLPLVYYLAATAAAVRFFSRPRRTSGYAPPASVLKPVRGVDFASYENFQSFCRQDYPQYEVLFCVNDLQDPAVPAVQRLMREFPERSIRLLSDAPVLGSNRKVSNLALLAREARYDLLVQSDGDVRVGPDYLRAMAAPFERPETGVVSCLYRGVAEPDFWAEMEALGAATDFAAGVLVADWTEGVTFALGASVATSKACLARIGGYEGLANVLADDYELGNRAARSGAAVSISSEIVETVYPAQGFRGFWEHQSRWAKTVRLCRPASYAALLVTFGLPWALIGGAATGSLPGAAGFLAAYLVMRLLQAWTVGVWGLRDPSVRRRLWLTPLSDAVHVAVWAGSFFSDRVTWGGTEFELSRNGEMTPVSAADGKSPRETR